MVGIKRTISTVIVALAVASAVRADMMPMSPSEGGAQRAQSVFVQTAPQQASDSQSSVTFLGAVDLDLQPIGSWLEVKSQVGDVAPAQAPQILTDRQNSLSLCLYALLGLGLCRSAPLVRKFHFGCIPEWYHNGGPSQIGHSFAISPDCLTSVPLACFVQPDRKAEKITVQYFSGVVTALLRKSQFTPTILASRGPPYMS